NAAGQVAQVAALADADDDRVALELGLIARDDLRPNRAVRSFGQDPPGRAHAANAAIAPQDLRYRSLVDQNTAFRQAVLALLADDRHLLGCLQAQHLRALGTQAQR